MQQQQSLLIGCGRDRRKKVYRPGNENWTGTLVTIDISPDVGADLVLDMEHACRAMPFDDEAFDEIGAYDVLEHWGRQGDWRGWFDEMSEYHRILKSGGTMGILVPINGDAIADPGHCRFFSMNHFGFLARDFYEQNASVTDYRWYIKRYWDIAHLEQSAHHISALLVKP